jgi:hypothetical protein
LRQNGPVDRLERTPGAQFFRRTAGATSSNFLAYARVGGRVACATTVPTPEVVRPHKNPHFIGISVMRENDRANFGNTNWLRRMPRRRALFSAGARSKPRRLHTKLSGVTVIFFPL